MADRDVDQTTIEVPQIDETLEAVLIAALNEAKKRLEAGEEVVPFTALAVGETLFIETHPGDDVDECFAAAEHTVANASGAAAYAFCYDGYVETDDGDKDVLIAEGGIPGEAEGFAVGYLYEMPETEDEAPVVDSDPVYIGTAPNFMALTAPASAREQEEDGEEDEQE